MKSMLVGLACVALMLLAYANPSAILVNRAQAEDTSGYNEWGRSIAFESSEQVSQTAEIPKGQYAYVFNSQTNGAGDVIPPDKWEGLRDGDLTQLRDKLENDLPGCKVQWIKVSWSSAVYSQVWSGVYAYTVKGFMVEALVKNENAGQTGAEIVMIILACAIVIAVITLCVMGSWVTWRVVAAAEALGPWMTIIIGLIAMFGIGFLLYSIFGGRVKYKGGKSKSLELGRTSIFHVMNYET